MKRFTFDKHWEAIKGMLKQRYAQLIDDDLAFVEGKGNELLAGIRKKIGASAGELRALLSELHTEAGGKWEQVKTKAGELAEEARETVATLGEEAGAQTSAAYHQARQGICTMRETCADYVRLHPGKSLLTALCVGFVAGLVIRR